MVLLFPPIPATVALAGTLLFNSMMSTTTIPITTSTPAALNYEFGNGSVQIDNPMKFRGMTFVEPKFLGAGGGGSVWNMKANGNGNGNSKNDVVVKISWGRSADSVRNECDILNVMEKQGVTGVERCLGNMEYKYDPRRVVIAMEPFVEDIDIDNDGGDITSSLADLSPKIARRSSIQLGKTMAQMLSANVVTTDLQPLISKSTGEVTLIDMTEAKVLFQQPDDRDRSKTTITETDKALINAFCTEIIGLIPDYLLDDAFSESFVKELHRIEMEKHVQLDAEVKEVLRDLPLKGVEKLL
jgi:hypothetical protein